MDPIAAAYDLVGALAAGRFVLAEGRSPVGSSPSPSSPQELR